MIKRVKYQLILIFLLISVNVSSATLDYLTKRDGLSHSSINTIFIDSQNIVWVGTESKVNWYMGGRFQEFTISSNANTNPLNNVTEIIEQNETTLWFINALVGVYRFDKNSWQLDAVNIGGLPEISDTSQIKGQSLYIDSENEVILSSEQGIFKLTESGDEFNLIPRMNTPESQFDRVINITKFYDQKLLFMTDSGLLIYDLDSNSIRSFLPQLLNGLSIGNVILDNDCFWIISFSSILKISRSTNETLYRYDADFPTSRIHDFHLDPNGDYWISGSHGIVRFSQNHRAIAHYGLPTLSTNTVIGSYSYDLRRIDNKLYVVFEGVIGVYDYSTNEFSYIPYDKAIQNVGSAYGKAYRRLVVDMSGNLWIPHSDGLTKVSFYKPEFDIYQNKDKLNRYLSSKLNGLASNLNRAILLDSKDRLWIGSEDMGISRFDKGLNLWRYFKSEQSNPQSLSHNHIRAIAEDRNGDIWVGTEGGGLNRFDETTQSWTIYKQGNLKDSIFAILADEEERLWIGHGDGLSSFSLSNETFTNYPLLTIDYISPTVRSLSRKTENELWLGTHPAVYGLDKKLSNIGGLFELNTDSGRVKQITLRNEQSESTQLIFDTNVDTSGNLWVATWGHGLFLLPRDSEQIIHYDISTGLPSNIVYSVLSNIDDSIWLSTPQSITSLKPCYEQTNDIECAPQITVYKATDGLDEIEFDSNSAFKSKNGEFYFGGRNGVVNFNPRSSFPSNNTKPNRTFIYKLTIQGEDIYPSDSHVLNGWIGQAKEINIDFNEQPFSLYITNNEYTQPHKNKYQYKIDDSNWIDIDNSLLQLTFNKLSYGNHQLQLRSTNNQELWSDTQTLQVNINPPFYLSNLAWFLYAFTIITLSYLLVKRRKQVQLARELELKSLINNKTLELNEQRKVVEHTLAEKQRFFENISHELHAPLNIINSNLNELGNELSGDIPKKQLETIHKNTARLTHLTTELFQLSTDGAIEHKRTLVNLYDSCEETVYQLNELATSHNKTIKIDVNKNIKLIMDEQAIETVLFNLISNAILYGAVDSSILISAQHTDSQCSLSIISHGELLSDKQFNRVLHPNKADLKAFPNFVSSGLNVVQDVLTKHNSELHASSDVAGVTTFAIIFSPQCVLKPLNLANTANLEAETNNNIDLKRIMIVEDNQELRNMLICVLEGQYEVLPAENGKLALELIIQFDPHAIISDVMMPYLDGFELCESIRSLDSHLRYMPIILLTAKDDLDSQRKGLSAGANDYITKPFNTALLEIKLDNLLKSYNKSRDMITYAALNKEIKPLKNDVVDNTFIERLKECMNENFSDSHFNVAKLANCLAMEERTLRRKTQALFSKQPKYIIRDYRLDCANRMLKSGDQIGIIAKECGFSTTSIFSRSYKVKYNISPKQAQKKILSQEYRTK